MHAFKAHLATLAVPALAVALLFTASTAKALPIGFGVNQGDVDYSESKSDHFIVYHDKRVPTEGLMTLNALEAARPLLEQWFAQHRKTPLPVVVSAVTENASFADFITDALELQTMGQGTKDLAWHEYTHSTMYRAFDTFMGPAYSITNLPWMPAWFLEGLAEAMSVSVGSDTTAGIERYQALTGDWPSYDRLHSLYSKANFFERGYATSGAITSWLLRKGDTNKLPVLLDDFFRYTQPWWWPWTLSPLSNALPLDLALHNYVNMDGEQLYRTYKKESTDFWNGWSKAPFLAAEKDKKANIASLSGLWSDGKDLILLMRIDSDLFEVVLKMDPKTGWVTDWRKLRGVPEKYNSIAGFTTATYRARANYRTGHYPDEQSTIWLKKLGKGAPPPRLIVRKGTVFGLWQTDANLVWIEQQQAQNRICSQPLTGGKVSCQLNTVVPKKLRALSFRPRRPGDSVAKEIWLLESDEKLTGTEYTVSVYDGKKNAKTRTILKTDARPVTVAFAGNDTWMLLAERNQRTLRRIGPNGECLGMVSFKDHILDLQGLADGSLVIGLYGGNNSYLKRLTKAQLQETACTKPDAHTSPIQWALQQKTPPDLRTAMVGSSLWTTKEQPLTPAEASALAARPEADRDQTADSNSQTAPSPAQWRAHPLFVFPWIGADDALGPQIGVVSVPLTDQMQNETVRATALFGIYSGFPDLELALTSTRFKPTLNLVLYEQQTYNGIYLKQDPTTGLYGDANLFYAEQGVRLESSEDYSTLGGTLSVGGAIKYAYLRPYIGPDIVRHGWLVEPGAYLSLVHAIGRVSITNALSGRTAPSQLNKHYEYNQIGASTRTTIGLPLDSKASFGLEGSRTRGTGMRHLQEYYTPLKTFIPGTGGGYNQNSYPVSNVLTSGLFDPQYGDTQARARADWTVPLIGDIDKELWILYLDRLDFTAFYNYGGAWNGESPPGGLGSLTRAHGYDIDLQLENKGVRFNVGFGVGQVVGRPFEAYLDAGFDALF